MKRKIDTDNRWDSAGKWERAQKCVILLSAACDLLFILIKYNYFLHTQEKKKEIN